MAIKRVTTVFDVDTTALDAAKKDFEGVRNAEKKATNEARNFRGIIAELNTKQASLKIRQEFAKTPAELKKINKELAETENKLRQATGTAQKQTSVLSNLGKAVAGAFAVGQVIQFGRSVLNVTANFEKMRAVLKTTLGSGSAADAAFANIREFAANTPFQVTEITDSFVKLANQGFVPTNKELEALGDLAASTGKSFDQLSEAIIDAQVGEFERLKEFGVRARQSGDQVTFTFKGVETTVKKSDKAIRDYVLSLGQAEGVTGSMAEISQTLGGVLSNLQDTADQAQFTIGTDLKEGFVDLLNIFESTNEEVDTGIGLLDIFNGLWRTIKVNVQILITPFKILLGILNEMFNAVVVVGKAIAERLASPFSKVSKFLQENVVPVFNDIRNAILDTANAILSFGTKALNKLGLEIDLNARATNFYNKTIGTTVDSVKEWLGLTEENTQGQEDLAEAMDKINDRTGDNNKLTKEQIKLLKEKEKAEKAAFNAFLKIVDREKNARIELQKLTAKTTQEKIDAVNAGLQRELENVNLTGTERKVLEEKAAQEITAIKKEEEDLQLQNFKDFLAMTEEASKENAEKEKKLREQQFNILNGLATSTGQLLGETIASSEKSIEDFGKNLILIALDELDKQITIAIAAATAKEVGTKGFIGLGTAAALTIGLKALFAGVRASIGGFATGTDDAPGGLAYVGERGKELMYVPQGAKILPNTQTGKYADAISAMYKNDFDNYVMSTYVPSMIKDMPKDDLPARLAKSLYMNSQFSDSNIVSELKKNREGTNIGNAAFLKEAIKEALREENFIKENTWR